MRFAEKIRFEVAGKLRRSSFFIRGITLLVLLILMVSVSYAWLGINSENNSRDMRLNVDAEDFNVEYNYYMVDVNNNDQIVVLDDLSAIEFNQYDLIFKTRNKYTPIVVRMAVSGEDLPSSGTITVKISRDTSKPLTETVNSRTQMSKYGSSVMRFTPFVGASYYSTNVTTQYDNIDAHYDTVRTLVGNDVSSGSKVFTTVTLSGNTISRVDKAEYIDLVYDYTQSDVIDGTLYLYIYITYDEGVSGNTMSGLVGIYQRTSGITAIGEDVVEFDYDLVSIEVKHS